MFAAMEERAQRLGEWIEEMWPEEKPKVAEIVVELQALQRDAEQQAKDILCGCHIANFRLIEMNKYEVLQNFYAKARLLQMTTEKLVQEQIAGTELLTKEQTADAEELKAATVHALRCGQLMKTYLEDCRALASDFYDKHAELHTLPLEPYIAPGC